MIVDIAGRDLTDHNGAADHPGAALLVIRALRRMQMKEAAEAAYIKTRFDREIVPYRLDQAFLRSARKRVGRFACRFEGRSAAARD